MEYSNIQYDVVEGIATILHNRPEAGNAESLGLLRELDNALSRSIADEAVRVIVIGGVGKHFSSGHDLKEGQAERSHFTVEQRYAFELEHFLGYALRIWDCPKPTIARVQGACIAAGFMVANMCDLVIASEDAFFSDPVCRTLASAAVEVLVHPWVLGTRRAKEILYTGRRLSAQEGYDFGMVNKVVPLAELEAETTAMARQIAAVPPFALSLTKRSLNRTADIQGFRNAIMAHFDTHLLSHTTEEVSQLRRQGFSTKAS